jgi:hypothetical protein
MIGFLSIFLSAYYVYFYYNQFELSMISFFPFCVRWKKSKLIDDWVADSEKVKTKCGVKRGMFWTSPPCSIVTFTNPSFLSKSDLPFCERFSWARPSSADSVPRRHVHGVHGCGIGRQNVGHGVQPSLLRRLLGQLAQGRDGKRTHLDFLSVSSTQVHHSPYQLRPA